MPRADPAGDWEPGDKLRVVFLCGPHRKDEQQLKELLVQTVMLKREGVITPWTVAMVPAGADADAVAVARIQSAHLVVLLMSADLFAQDPNPALDAVRAASDRIAIVPVRGRPINFDMLEPCFAKLRSLPPDAETYGPAISQYANPESAMADTATFLRMACVKLRSALNPAPPPPAPRGGSSFTITTTNSNIGVSVVGDHSTATFDDGNGWPRKG